MAEDVTIKLSQKGHDVTVLTTDGCDKRLPMKGKVLHKGVKVEYFGNVSNTLLHRFNIAIPWQMRKTIDDAVSKCDIVHIHEFRSLPAYWAAKAAIRHNVPYVLQPHGSTSQKVGRTVMKRVFDQTFGLKVLRNADMIVAVSEQEAAMDKDLGAPLERIRVIYNGLNPIQRVESSFRSQWVANNEKLILYLGRINETKGLDFLLKAYAIIAHEREDVTLIIAGRDDGYLGEVKTLIKDLNLVDRVKLHGEVKEADKAAALSSADVFIHTVSYMGGVGLLPLEATLCGVPVIATIACGEVMRNGGFGHLVEYGDTKQLASTIDAVLDNPSTERSLVEKGRRYILDNFVWDRVIEKVEETYADCIRDY